MPVAGQIDVFHHTSDAASHPVARVQLPAGYKVLGGGAHVESGAGWGNLLTASYPDSIFSWVASSKDQDQADPRQVTAWAYGFYDPSDQYEVQIFSATSGNGEPSASPTATAAPQAAAVLPWAYVLVGGGGQTHWSVSGQFLTASMPTPDRTGWQVASHDHLHSDPGSVTAYAVGIRARGVVVPTPSVGVWEAQSTTKASGNSVAVAEPPGTGMVLIGGGAAVIPNDPPGAGNFLTGSYPDPSGLGGWAAACHDHTKADPANVAAYALGLRWTAADD